MAPTEVNTQHSRSPSHGPNKAPAKTFCKENKSSASSTSGSYQSWSHEFPPPFWPKPVSHFKEVNEKYGRAKNYIPGFVLFTFKPGVRIKTSEGRRELNDKTGVYSTQPAMCILQTRVLREGRTETHKLFLPLSMNTNNGLFLSKTTQAI